MTGQPVLCCSVCRRAERSGRPWTRISVQTEKGLETHVGHSDGRETTAACTYVAGSGLKRRTEGALRRAGITRFGDLFAKSKMDLLSIRGFGRKALYDVNDLLECKGFPPPVKP